MGEEMTDGDEADDLRVPQRERRRRLYRLVHLHRPGHEIVGAARRCPAARRSGASTARPVRRAADPWKQRAHSRTVPPSTAIVWPVT